MAFVEDTFGNTSKPPIGNKGQRNTAAAELVSLCATPISSCRSTSYRHVYLKMEYETENAKNRKGNDYDRKYECEVYAPNSRH